jgi:hypothetical protein
MIVPFAHLARPKRLRPQPAMPGKSLHPLPSNPFSGGRDLSAFNGRAKTDFVSQTAHSGTNSTLLFCQFFPPT